MAYQDHPAANFSNWHEAPPVTMAGLLKHADKFGLDNAHTGYRGAAEKYTKYSSARADSLIHVARTFLTEEAYIAVLDALGFSFMAEQAREDWQVMHSGA